MTRNRLLYILDHFAAHRIFIAWSGGKDSTILLYILRDIWLQQRLPGPGPKAVSLDTGCKFPEVLNFRDQLAQAWDIDLIIARPNLDLSQYPLARDPVQCCLDLKVKPLQETMRLHGAQVLFSGARLDEAPHRQNKPWLEEKDFYWQANPILHWTEMDIWSGHQLAGLDYCPLYARGYRSLGCQPCTRKVENGSEREGRNQDKEDQLHLLSNLGYF